MGREIEMIGREISRSRVCVCRKRGGGGWRFNTKSQLEKTRCGYIERGREIGGG